MKHKIYILSLFFLICGSASAQDEGFYVQLNKDTILAGNVLQLTFVANNVAGQFEAPDFGDLNIISGPNTATTMSMINGTVSQRASYGYTIYLEEIGEVIIPPAYLNTKEGTLETEPYSVIVLPNPEGIIEKPPTESGFFQFDLSSPPMKKSKKKNKQKSKKKKRKLKKI
ncbi:MAG: BatD family protein [Saprospiraceae bacterium]|nr:BatD family protein [Saprospiraceae bacterium]